MFNRIVVCVCVALSLGVAPAGAQQPRPDGWKGWRAGAAKVNITPAELMWMSGYAGRTKPAEGKLTDLWAKALVLEDPSGRRAVLVTMDLVGIERALSVEVCQELKQKYGLAREAILLSVSHTHTGPVVRSNLNVMYQLDAKQQKQVADYAKVLHANLVRVVGDALKQLAPAELSWGIGKTTFAVNRRTNKEADVPKLRASGLLKGPVDHDVPVLAVRAPKGELRAVVFGYACHATVLSFYQWSGDYPGFAQIELEKAHPGMVALFWAGCGADQNPLPRRTVGLAEEYGRKLAGAVEDMLAAPLTPLGDGKLGVAYAEIDLPFADLPSREQLVKDSLSKSKYEAARAKLLLKQMAEKGSLRGTYPYPVQVWQMGPELTWVALGGEVVVDYALRLKQEIGPGKTWIAGYCNDVMAYIPSLRVLKEGGYEGGGAMVYYGLPTVWGPRIEELIVAAVHRQVKQARATPTLPR
ncbi:MAG TPA: neutral/alkaline non-lysosomal ceramidase N-terminal domain-containing protein [Gemmataceae bacterium]|nr:neutral/alkaline non-lysosomal ceramidase N-terminal domain-containing protein [Gemmataceae bacterium]